MMMGSSWEWLRAFTSAPHERRCFTTWVIGKGMGGDGDRMFLLVVVMYGGSSGGGCVEEVVEVEE